MKKVKKLLLLSLVLSMLLGICVFVTSECISASPQYFYYNGERYTYRQNIYYNTFNINANGSAGFSSSSYYWPSIPEYAVISISCKTASSGNLTINISGAMNKSSTIYIYSGSNYVLLLEDLYVNNSTIDVSVNSTVKCDVMIEIGAYVKL